MKRIAYLLPVVLPGVVLIVAARFAPPTNYVRDLISLAGSSLISFSGILYYFYLKIHLDDDWFLHPLAKRSPRFRRFYEVFWLGFGIVGFFLTAISTLRMKW